MKLATREGLDLSKEKTFYIADMTAGKPELSVEREEHIEPEVYQDHGND